jgi:hypothetical protein
MDGKTLFGYGDVGRRWGISPWTVRRAVDRGELKAINIGARRMICLAEIQRAEQFGIGSPRRRTRGQGQRIAAVEATAQAS